MVLTSCIYDDGEPDRGPSNPGEEKPFVSLRFGTLYTRAGSEGKTVTEKIGTLRIIMLNKDALGNNKIEINKHIPINGALDAAGYTFSGDGENADIFRYEYTSVTVSGEKKFYIIANEESLGEVSFDEEYTEGISRELLSMTSITRILDSFDTDIKTGKNGGTSTSSRGDEIEAVLNSVHFRPEYTPNENGELYLPYSAVYSGYKVGADNTGEYHGNSLETFMYIVPVATKFSFDFVNYRKETVKIEDIKISSAHEYNYLMAQLSDREKTKKIEGEEYYWIDWLAELTQQAQESGNVAQFNNNWGWIKDYRMPTGSMLKTLGLKDPAEGWIVKSRVNSYTPSTNHFGPMFVPESRNAIRGTLNQAYYLSFYMHDTNTEEVKGFEDNLLPELESLFRATHVIITVTLYDEDVDIYAQISPWNTETFRGYLLEEDI